MPDVDHPAFTEHGERHLRGGDPLRQAVEQLSEDLVHGRVPGVEQPVELAAAPSRHQLDPDVDGFRNSPDRGERHLIEPAALDPGDRRSRDPGNAGQVRLPQPATNPDRPDRSAEPEIIHSRAMMAIRPSPALI